MQEEFKALSVCAHAPTPAECWICWTPCVLPAAETLGNSGPPDPDPGHCVNSHDMCETWASSGECTKNPGFMVRVLQGPLRTCL